MEPADFEAVRDSSRDAVGLTYGNPVTIAGEYSATAQPPNPGANYHYISLSSYFAIVHHECSPKVTCARDKKVLVIVVPKGYKFNWKDDIPDRLIGIEFVSFVIGDRREFINTILY